MKVSRAWLQTFSTAPLPDIQALSDALTFHAFEIESVVNGVLDVKVTPNRGHDCLSHRGIAKEISAILNILMKDYYDKRVGAVFTIYRWLHSWRGSQAFSRLAQECA